MATLALQTVGTVIGSAVGGPFGPVLGRAVGAIAGNVIDQRLFSGSKDRVVEGPRLDNTRLLGSNEGAPIPKLYGRNRVSGEIIWATEFEEVRTENRSGGGKGTGGSRSGSTITYTYFANFAVGICEGPVACIRRIWANGVEVDLTTIEFRFYEGTETQPVDPLIEAKQGPDNTPAYRGLAYIVFESFPLEEYGNVIPQLTFEIVRPVGALEGKIQAISVIPGSTEYGYSDVLIDKGGGSEPYSAYNRHSPLADTNWKASIDELISICPNLKTVTLVVSWFGTDLRAGECLIKPGVTARTGAPWAAAGRNRETAHQISQIEGRAAYGGTPSDASVLRAIADLKARGLRVVFYPFIMMDIANGNTLPNPGGGIGQPVYPWRGEITCHPAPGQPGTADKSELARTQLDQFANRSQDSFRELILHYANLCATAGGVDGFMVGTEMRGVTRVRDQIGAFPFVETLIGLAGDAKQILGNNCTVTYAADWSEYFGYQPADGSDDVLYNLDPLWASPNIDVIGIDNYMPLSDWRSTGDPENQHLNTPFDLENLKANIAGGEGFDWYYATGDDRLNGNRTPITDGLGEPWVFRYKDLVSWWTNPHHERAGGVRSQIPTLWQPQSKPIYFTELGCPAVDKGANQPNVFFDPKSDQSALPYFSSGNRDDLIQRRFLEAHLEFWIDPQNNPVSAVYGEPMVKLDETAIWCWDARPFPWFPLATATWSDGQNWHLGHWMNGRLGAAPLAELIRQILEDHGYYDADIEVNGYVDGYVVPDAMSARSALEPLLNLFDVLVVEEDGQIKFVQHAYSSKQTIDPTETVQENDDPQKSSNRISELELPAEVVINHMSLFGSYRQTATKSRRMSGESDRQISFTVPAVINDTEARRLAEAQLRLVRTSRDTCQISLPMKHFEIAPGDVLEFKQDHRRWLVENIETTVAMNLGLRLLDDAPDSSIQIETSIQPLIASPVFGKPLALLMDLPLLRSTDVGNTLMHLAVFADPWAGTYAVYTSPESSGYKLRTNISSQATIGQIVDAVSFGAIGRWDRANKIRVSLLSGTLSSATQTATLNGANLALIGDPAGAYEIIQFQQAALMPDGTWELSVLNRGLFGTEFPVDIGIGESSTFVSLDQAIQHVELETSEAGLLQNWRIGPAGNSVASASYEEISRAHQGRSNKMLSPVHIRVDVSSSDYDLSWVRRGRVDADRWEPANIPLDADHERYLVEILDASNVIREIEVAEPVFRYSEAERMNDFPQGASQYTFRISQIGSDGLPGTKREFTHFV